MRWDHPRLRGEQRADTRTVYCSPGSPPLARGTGFLRAPTKSGTGITPACAGNSPPLSSGSEIVWDHPRLRGEQLSAFAHAAIFLGSPPLARGTDVIIGMIPVLHGITPACAGNSTDAAGSSTAEGDHPRLRGEQRADMPSVFSSWGSPPLARGTAVLQTLALALGGITPACAGNRSSTGVSHPVVRDHPRLRGEQLGDVYKMPGGLGSPPLARGTVDIDDDIATAARITPACAGNRLFLPVSYYLSGDHPRLRGEQ